ncbi:ABC transporter G family member 40 [Citrus sinensis]|uniref:ABC transporter G family member 40 n=1 Tax=Citrus sinensis TaxID=2711 RepID=A0ACB8JAI7_CITSI|nr:ABC transporter G family member 40 [Citrus sinensis]
MEGSHDSYLASTSLRGSISRWRTSSVGAFSKSLREEDDEEALKWAALEKLPTYNRLRKGLLTTSRGEAFEVDVSNLGLQQRQRLINKLVKVTEVDNEKFLLKLKSRIDRVGIDLPKVEVRYEHLNVEGEAYLASKALPSFTKFYTTVFEDIFNYLGILPSRKKHLTILKDVSGIIKPGRMTLLLGPPASGKTTLLLALAGKLDSSLKVSGRATYNGHDMGEFVPERAAAYISQHDNHIGEMTVRETLAFSARCQGVGSRYELLTELARRENEAGIKPDPDIDVYMKGFELLVIEYLISPSILLSQAIATEGQEANVITDYYLKVLGLEVCADTMVGDEMIRGISGGERKRVTTGEMMVGPALALFMDEISTGLDSSTTFQIVNCLKQHVHINSGTAVISLLQPAPETYDLFDDIILLSDGQIVYQGPRELVLEFFESMGFKCPKRKGVADFLQEVTSRKDQKQYWTHKEKPYRFVTVEEFAEAFQSFHVGQKISDELRTPFDKSKSHRAALTTEVYGVGKRELLKTCISRELLLMKRNSFVYIFKLTQISSVALAFMTLFFRTKMHKHSVTDGGIYAGALFFATAMVMFNGLAEISMTIAKLPVFYKQRDFRFFPPWAYAIPSWILKIPISFLEVAVWVFLTYYVIGCDPNAGRFFKQYLLLLAVNQMASALFRLIAATGRSMVVANTFGTFALLVLFALGGFVLSQEDIKKWWKWAYWCSPMSYAQNAIVANEFLGYSWKKFTPNSYESIGVQVLKSRGFFAHAYWYWLGLGALFGFILLFNLGFTMAITFLNQLEKPRAVITEESESNKQDNRIRGTVQLSTRGESGEDISGRNSSSKSLILTEAQGSHPKKRGMILPFEPHSLTFDEVVYSVDMPQEMKLQGVLEDKLVLLNGLGGAFRPGVLTALMGVSGAGKTTLMDVLSGRKTGGYITGNITISGYPKKQETFARISGYCEQNDIHSPFVTVYESLLYSAWLRLPPEVDSETRKMFIEEVMELVELKPLIQSLVGLPGVSGLSTEQRKRLTIAVELVANPSIIFMDEPTSGLDARAAAIVMRTVRNTVDTGRTVVCTIHQPGIDIFDAFDELFLMKRGGQEIYVGPLGRHSCQLISYFEAIPGVEKIKDGYNPATWMLEVTASSQEVALGVDFNDIFRCSELYRRNKALIEELSKPTPGSKDLYFPTQYSQSAFTQFVACLWKQHWSYWRNPQYTAVRFFFTAFIAVLLGSLFWDMGSKTRKSQDLFNAMGSMFTAIIFLGLQYCSSVQPVVSVERTVFYREKAAGMYAGLPWALAQAMIEIPYIFVQSVVYCVIVYAMMGYDWTAEKFSWYFFFMYITLLLFTFYGMLTVAITPNHHIAAIVSTLFYGIWYLFCGFVIPRPRIPVWWRWYYWANPIAWTLYGLIASQFGDVEDQMENGETVKHFLRDYFGFKHDLLGVVAGVLTCFVALFGFVFALGIKQLNFQRR